MLVENQIITTRWHSRNKEHLISKGYEFTKIGDEINVRLEDMKHGSKCRVKVKCDYCGKIFEKTYKDYFRQRDNHEGDCCLDCHCLKSQETNQIKYHSKSPASSPEVMQKVAKTCMEKYGVPCASMSQDIRNKISQTNIKKYGVENVFASEEIKKKIRETCIRKYGGPSSMSSPEIKAKAMDTLIARGKVPTSKPEQDMDKKLISIYGEERCTPQYRLDKISMDCMVDLGDTKIDVEFDGSYWHQDARKDMLRDFFAIRNGFKVLRFKGDYNAPAEEQIKDSISYLVNSEKHHLIVNV